MADVIPSWENIRRHPLGGLSHGPLVSPATWVRRWHRHLGLIIVPIFIRPGFHSDGGCMDLLEAPQRSEHSPGGRTERRLGGRTYREGVSTYEQL